MILIPFERRDINFAVDKHRIQRGPIAEGSRFLAIYDQTYGSLRLSGRIIEDDVLQRTLQEVIKLLKEHEVLDTDPETMAAIESLYNSSLGESSDLSFESDAPPQPSYKYERVILPGGKGLNTNRNNEEFEVEAVFFSPSFNSLCYRGRHASIINETIKVTIPIKSLIEIPGESKIGFYNYDTGEIEAANSFNM